MSYIFCTNSGTAQCSQKCQKNFCQNLYDQKHDKQGFVGTCISNKSIFLIFSHLTLWPLSYDLMSLIFNMITLCINKYKRGFNFLSRVTTCNYFNCRYYFVIYSHFSMIVKSKFTLM